MPILFASNDASDIAGTSNVTTVGRFNASFVSSGIQSPNAFDQNTVQMLISWTNPTTDGDVWIHWDQINNGMSWDTLTDGYRARATDSSGNVLIGINISNGTHQYQGAGTNMGPTYTGANGVIQSIDYHVNKVGTTFITEVFVDGALFATRTFTDGSRGLPSRIDFGGFDLTRNTGTITLSQIMVSTTSTLGRKLGVLNPASAGNYGQWSGDFAALSDYNPGTVAASTTAGQRVSSVMTAWGGATAGTIEKMVLRQDGTSQGGAPTRVNQFVRIGTTDHDGTAVVMTDSVVPYYQEFLTNPSTTNPWLFTELATTQIGLLSVA